MKLNTILFSIIGIIIATFITRPLFPDNPCKVIKANPDGTYLIEIGGKQFVALTEEKNTEYSSTAKELKKQKLINAELRSLIKLDQDAEKECMKGIENKTEYILKLEEGYEKCKTIVKKYDQLYNKQPFLSVSAGLGYVNDDLPIGGIVGVGIHNFMVWGTLSQNHRGLYAGYHYPFK